jgi:DNA modification methylase
VGRYCEFTDVVDEDYFKALFKETYRTMKNGGTLVCFYDIWKLESLKNILESCGFRMFRFIEWIKSPERKASRKEKEYAINRLDGLIKKIEYAMEKAVVRVVRQLKQPEKKKAVVEEIKKEVKPSIREKLALNVAKIQREEAERKQLNKGRSHSSDLEL